MNHSGFAGGCNLIETAVSLTVYFDGTGRLGAVLAPVIAGFQRGA